MAMFTRRSHEGYLMVDHRACDSGVAPEIARLNDNAMPVGRGAMVEMPTITCSHCSRVVIVNPMRTRERAYCPKCDHYICDECETVRIASGGACKTWKQVLDEADEAALRRQALILT